MEKKIKRRNDLDVEEQSPRCILEIPTSSDSDNSSGSSSCSPEKSSPPVSNHQHGLQWNKMLKSIKKKSIRSLRRKQKKLSTPSDCNQILVAKPSWRYFTYEELVAATDDFNSENVIGKGGHAEVYIGVLPDGETVAIKKLMEEEGEEQYDEEDRVSDFLSELGIIAHVNHPNAAKLRGFSIDRGLHFVLEYSPHGSLCSLLFGSEDCLDWNKRYKVALGIANGLSYLHNDCPRRIIHRDIKASNILLGKDYEAQISDFGLAKWLPENWDNHIVHPIEGTIGYLAPEYFMHGIVDEKTDVFAFGVLLLEIITGRRAVDTSSRESLVTWAKPLLERVEEIVDPRLGNDYNETEMKRVMQTASMCIHHVSATRPDMNRLVQMLRGDDDRLDDLSHARTVSLDEWILQDHTSSSYLTDLIRHRQLLME